MKEKQCTKCGLTKSFNDFFGQKISKDKKRSECKECNRKVKAKYLSTEKGFMKAVYYQMGARKDDTNTRGRFCKVELTVEEFFQLWENHKKKYGMICPYTGDVLEFKRNSKGIRGSQVSVDRIDNTKEYSKENIVFCSSRANHMKGPITIEMMKKVLEIYDEKRK